MHGRVGVVDHLLRGLEVFPQDARVFGDLDPGPDLVDGRGGGRGGGLGLTAGAGLAVGRAARGVLRAVVRVERPGEGEPIVALGDRVVGVLKRGGGVGVLLGRVLLGAGGAGRVERALREVDLFLRGSRTGGEQDQRQQQDGQSTHRDHSI